MCLCHFTHAYAVHGQINPLYSSLLSPFFFSLIISQQISVGCLVSSLYTDTMHVVMAPLPPYHFLRNPSSSKVWIRPVAAMCMQVIAMYVILS